MKKHMMVLVIALFTTFTANAQEGEQLKIITGVRVNPFVMYDFNGNKTHTC